MKKRISELEKNELRKISNIMWEESKREYKSIYSFILERLEKDKEESNSNLDTTNSVLYTEDEKVYEFVRRLIKKESYKDIMEYRQLHCRIVADLSCRIYNEYFEGVSKKESNILYLAALIHDIKKIDKKHYKKGKKFIKSNLAEVINMSGIELEEENKIEKRIVKIVDMHKLIDDSKGNEEVKKYNKKREMLENENLINQVFCIRVGDKLSKLEYKGYYDDEIKDSEYLKVKIKEKIENETEDLINIEGYLKSIREQILEEFF